MKIEMRIYQATRLQFSRLISRNARKSHLLYLLGILHVTMTLSSILHCPLLGRKIKNSSHFHKLFSSRDPPPFWNSRHALQAYARWLAFVLRRTGHQNYFLCTKQRWPTTKTIWTPWRQVRKDFSFPCTFLNMSNPQWNMFDFYKSTVQVVLFIGISRRLSLKDGVRLRHHCVVWVNGHWVWLILIKF